MNEEIGTVVSSLDGPSPSALDFVVTKGIVHRGQFVEMDYSEGTLIALITNVFKTNRYFERADSVKEFEASGRKLFEQFPTTEWEYLMAQTRPLGVFKGNVSKRPSYPPSPGTKVRIADAKSLEKFLGFDEDAGIHLGEVEYHGLPVKLNMTRLLKKHLAILAMSGAGKSVASKSLIEELLDRKKEHGRIAVIVMDAHGEYTSFAEPLQEKEKSETKRDYSSITKVIKAREIRIGVPNLSVAMISKMISGLSPAQARDLERVLASLRSEMRSGLGPFDLNAVRKAILEDKEIKESTSQVLLSWLYNLEELRLFGKTDAPALSDIVKPGHLTVIDLSDVVNMKKKQIIVSYFAQKLFNERRAKRVPPFFFVVEEAHSFAPEKTKEEFAISKRIIETIAREGRKFGASLCLISQRPINLSTTALAQCNSHIILRITNPYDLDHIGKTSEGIDRRAQDMISSLKVGEALLVGEAVNFPVFFRVRMHYSAPSKHEMSLEQAGRDFEEGKAQEEKEVEEFL